MNILILGASYGLLVASILLEKGFKCTIVCNEDEDEKLKKNGFVLNIADKNLFYSPQIFLKIKCYHQRQEILTITKNMIYVF